MNVVYIAIVLYLSLNLLGTYIVVARSDFDRVQKIIQVTLIWFLPVVGVTAILLIFKSFDEPRRNKQSFGGGPNGSSNINSAGSD